MTGNMQPVFIRCGAFEAGVILVGDDDLKIGQITVHITKFEAGVILVGDDDTFLRGRGRSQWQFEAGVILVGDDDIAVTVTTLARYNRFEAGVILVGDDDVLWGSSGSSEARGLKQG